MAVKRGISFYEAVATLVGTTIGAGIFGIPYVVAKSGILAGIFNLVLLGFIVLMINLYLGEVCLRTKKTHQLAGFAELYLGKKGKIIMMFAALFSMIGAMLAYIIGEGQVLSAIFGGDALKFSILFFVIASALVYFDLSIVKRAELVLGIAMLALIMVIIGISIGHFEIGNLILPSSGNFLLPYGVILFALTGASAIPAMEAEIKNSKKNMKKAIIIGTLIPFIVYLMFMITVVGVTGLGTTEIATIGLGAILGKYMLILGSIFAFFAMFTSFLIIGLALKWMLHYDYYFSKTLSWFIACFVPLAIFLAGARSFVGVIGLTGVIAGGIEGIMIILIAKAAKNNTNRKIQKKPEYMIPLNWIFAAIIIAIFLFGIASEFIF